ncbi:hypothetical protein C8J56DRAFT_826276 [Mycena floridula]|nr:hypothetical protein C8J56DRAFT_826276 [Mycena floridula]
MGAEDLSALIIAAVAFVIAVLQVVQQYVASATTRNKVNHAAIGEWSSMNRYWWSWKSWQFKVEYVQPSIDVATVRICIGLEKKLIVSRVRKIVVDKCPHLASSNFAFNSRIGEGAQGARLTQTPRVAIDHRYVEDIPEIPAWTRHRVLDCEKALESFGSSKAHAKATWLNLMIQFVGGKIQVLLPKPKDRVYEDADTISSSFDNPCMHIFASDLVTLGLLLDMAIIDIDLNGNRFEMAGLFCSLSGADRFGHGLTIAYSGKPGHHHRVLGCTSEELRALSNFAHGQIFVGDMSAPFLYLGYNAIFALFDRVLENLSAAVQPSDDDPSPFSGKALPQQWFETSLKPSSGDDDEKTPKYAMHDEMPNIDDPDLPMADLLEADSHRQWRRWSTPLTPLVPFLLALSGNLAVANAFPHALLHDWSQANRQQSTLRAYEAIQTSSFGFITTPDDFLSKAWNHDIIIMDGYKTANNWGCEHAGMRSWLATNMTEFVWRITKCWTNLNEADYSRSPVPILSQLQGLLSSGTLDRTWGINYNIRGDRGRHWKGHANSLLWLQIMMFDTWIAQRVDIITGGTGRDEVSVPATIEAAQWAKDFPINQTETTGWKVDRLNFAREYLTSLAEGIHGQSPSCMSPTTVPSQTLWEGLSSSNAEDWYAVDAVLTLRASVMATRLELMKDSSILLELRERDPLVRMI